MCVAALSLGLNLDVSILDVSHFGRPDSGRLDIFRLAILTCLILIFYDFNHNYLCKYIFENCVQYFKTG